MPRCIAATDIFPPERFSASSMRSPSISFSVGSLAEKPTMLSLGFGSSLASFLLMAVLKDSGAVGDINLRYFDKNGNLISSDLNERIIGLNLEELKKIGHVVGVVGGKAKFKAIRAALIGSLIDVLITDHITAEKLLQS